MIKINSLSGGKTSSYMAVHHPADIELFAVVCIDDVRCKPDRYIHEYASRKLERYAPVHGEFIATAEDDRTLVAMMDLEQIIGREIVWTRGISFDRLIDEGDQTRLPSWARRYCTVQMKLMAIFQYWFENVGQMVDMRIGFRFDEFKRMERFFNNQDPSRFSIPVSCDTRGSRRMRHQDFKWRYVSMPLIEAGVTKSMVDEYWRKNNRIPGDLFNAERHIEFPAISNCVGCFHKPIEHLACQAIMNRTKMEWFADQEEKQMGRWLDQNTTYRHIIDNAFELAKETYFEVVHTNQTCDSEGCTS